MCTSQNWVMRNCPNADKEEWDIFEENDYSPLGDTMYQSVFDSLQMKTLVLNLTEDVSNGEKPAASSSSNGVALKMVHKDHLASYKMLLTIVSQK